MKLTLPAILVSSLFMTLAASEADQENKFLYIQPIAVEKTSPPPKVQPPVERQKYLFLSSESEDEENDTVTYVFEDADKDGIADEYDECPNTPEGVAVNIKGCEKDSDNDGVVDSKDQCPNSPKEFTVDGFGCPQTATLNVHFQSSKYDITADVINDLKAFAEFLNKNPHYNVVIYGYTDTSGNKKKNQILSQNRANSVKTVLTRYGIDENRLIAIGRGGENPVADNATKEGRAQNRRIEVELVRN